MLGFLPISASPISDTGVAAPAVLVAKTRLGQQGFVARRYGSFAARVPGANIYNRSTADSLTLTDALTRAVIYGRSLSDGLTMADAVTRQAVYARTLGDGATSADSQARSQVLGRLDTESLTMADALTRVA